MTRAVIVAIACVLGAAPVLAQSPSVVAPQAYQQQFENDLVRVTRVHYAPNETIAEHEHPSRPSIFIYLNDGPPILFKHQHGESGDYAATRAATKAGGYRLAAGRQETHSVENRSELPSDFLQVELKVNVDAKTFAGRRLRDAEFLERTATKLEFEASPLRIVRASCVDLTSCTAAFESLVNPTLVVVLKDGTTHWLAANTAKTFLPFAGEYLLIGFTHDHRDTRP